MILLIFFLLLVLTLISLGSYRFYTNPTWNYFATIKKYTKSSSHIKKLQKLCKNPDKRNDILKSVDVYPIPSTSSIFNLLHRVSDEQVETFFSTCEFHQKGPGDFCTPNVGISNATYTFDEDMTCSINDCLPGYTFKNSSCFKIGAPCSPDSDSDPLENASYSLDSSGSCMASCNEGFTLNDGKCIKKST